MSAQESRVPSRLARWNDLPEAESVIELLGICGSPTWAQRVSGKRPFSSVDELVKTADDVWFSLSVDDWMEAFLSHPRIGDASAPGATRGSLVRSHDEQRQILGAGSTCLMEMAEANRIYEEQYGFRFIICASGRSVEEILDALHKRLYRVPSIEVAEAAQQQRQITQLRLRKWLDL